MITTYILSFFVGYLGVLMGFRLALDRVQLARSRIKGLHQDRIRQVAAIRQLGKTSNTSKRRVRDSELLVEQLTAEANSLEERLKTVKRSDNRLVVLDERRLPEDHQWILMISGPGGQLPEAKDDERQENWIGHMRFLVWATTLERAIHKAATRFPASRGFKVEATEASARKDPSQAA